VKASDHPEAQPAAPAKDLGYPRSRPDEWLEILSVEVELIHAEKDRVNRIWRRNRLVLVLVGFNQGHEHIEPIVLRSTGLRVPKPLHLGESCLVLPHISYWFDFHRYTTSTSIRSYWAWLPTNLMKSILAVYLMATTRRYLFPPMLKTTRELPTKLAFLCCRLMSAGVAQSAFDASANHARRGASESWWAGASQNSRRVRRAMILTAGAKRSLVPEWEQLQRRTRRVGQGPLGSRRRRASADPPTLTFAWLGGDARPRGRCPAGRGLA